MTVEDKTDSKSKDWWKHDDSDSDDYESVDDIEPLLPLEELAVRVDEVRLACEQEKSWLRRAPRTTQSEFLANLDDQLKRSMETISVLRTSLEEAAAQLPIESSASGGDL